MSSNNKKACEGKRKRTYYVLLIGENYPRDKKIIKVEFDHVWCHLALILKLDDELPDKLSDEHPPRRIESYWSSSASSILNCIKEGVVKIVQSILNGRSFMIIAERHENVGRFDRRGRVIDNSKETWIFKVLKGQYIAKIIIERNKAEKLGRAIVKNLTFYELKGDLKPAKIAEVNVGMKIGKLPSIDWDFLFQNCINCKACSYPCNALK